VSKTARVDKPTLTRFYLPESLRARVDLLLWSDVESRVPHGAYTELFTRLTREWLDLVDQFVELDKETV
jgi:hypothetical protein